MPGLFVVKAIEAAPMSSNRVRAYILNALKRQAKRAQVYLAMTTEHWVTPPIFRMKLVIKLVIHSSVRIRLEMLRQ